ncbi:MAG: hypothetical protein HGA78_08915 [Nitrospirales bacterium]|nr:hypothetical protein [Nitrospirales bacterium]
MKIISGVAVKAFGASLLSCRFNLSATIRQSKVVRNIAYALIVALSLTSCKAIETVQHGVEQSHAAEEDIEKAVGTRPSVGFSWENGILKSVTIEFAALPQEKSLQEIKESALAAVKRRFMQEPDEIVISFSIKKP